MQRRHILSYGSWNDLSYRSVFSDGVFVLNRDARCNAVEDLSKRLGYWIVPRHPIPPASSMSTINNELLI